METNPSVSIIVTIHNAERHIKECINSILSQNLRHLEIVLADDNSTDGSFELCRKLYGGKGKFKLVRNENPRSLGATRNLGLKHASGDYVCFARGDDFILPGALEKFYSVAKETGTEVIRAAGWYDSAKAAASNQPTWSVYAQEGFLNSNLLNKLEEHWKKGATSSQAELCFVRRKFLQDKGITFRETCAADELFNFALLCTTKSYYILHEAFYVRRDVEDAATAEEFSEGLRAMLDGAAYLDSFLERIPRFNGYESWRENLLASFFYKLAAKYTIPFQKTNKALDASIEQTLTPYFPSGKSFAKYFFKSFNTLSRQAELLAKQHKQLSAELMALFNRLELAGNKIVFVNVLGRGFGCNPKYIALEIMRQDLPVDMVWLVGDMNEPMPARIRKARYGSVEAVYELATAKVIVTNVKNLLPFPAKKRGQFFIMTWHGGQGFKLIERDAEERLSPAYVRESKANSSITDLMMVNTQEQYDEFRRVCWYDGEILRCGLPRNDIFFRRDEKLTAQVRQALNVPTTNKVVMYAPTFRDNVAVMPDVCRLDTQRLLEVLRKRFGGDWTLIMRFHPNVARYFAQTAFSDNVINATDYPDMQELILIADVLISDYSSVVCDFMFTGKPVFLYAKDCDTYTTERGFKPLYFDLPYKVNKSAEELFNDIATYDAAALAPKIKHFIETVKPFDSGHASEKVVERIKAVLNAPTVPHVSKVPSNMEAFEYVQNKYSAFLDALPVYEAEGDTPKIFWWCWLQGAEKAPALCKACLKSLRRHYSDYQINVITLENISDYVKFPEYIVRKFKGSSISPTHFSDLLRLELLINHGGIWIDSSVFVTGREPDYLREPLFIFQTTWRNEPAHLGSNWFIVACKGNPILKTTRDLLYRYWEDHEALGNGGFYFMFHCMFNLAAGKYPDAWSRVPLYSNIPPHVLQMEFFKPYKPDRFEQIKRMSYFHKLTWKYPPAQLSPERTAGSNYEYLMKFYS